MSYFFLGMHKAISKFYIYGLICDTTHWSSFRLVDRYIAITGFKSRMKFFYNLMSVIVMNRFNNIRWSKTFQYVSVSQADWKISYTEGRNTVHKAAAAKRPHFAQGWLGPLWKEYLLWFNTMEPGTFNLNLYRYSIICVHVCMYLRT